MADQTGCREPHDFIGSPPGQWGSKGSIRGFYSGIFEHREIGTPERSPEMSFSFVWRPYYDKDFDFEGFGYAFLGLFKIFWHWWAFGEHPLSIKLALDAHYLSIGRAFLEFTLEAHCLSIQWALIEHPRHWALIWRASNTHLKSI